MQPYQNYKSFCHWHGAHEDMSFLKRLTNSFSDCLHIASVRKMNNAFTFARFSPFDGSFNASINRLQTMSKLGENLFEIKMQIAELNIQNDKYAAEAAQAIKNGRSDADLRFYYQRSREIGIQKVALQKSERTLMATVSSLESQGNIEKIRKVLSYTLETHHMAREAAQGDASSEQLLEGFEHISNTIEQERTILDGLDAHISELRDDPVSMEQDIHEDPNFVLWKSKLANPHVLQPDPVSFTLNHPQKESAAIGAGVRQESPMLVSEMAA